MLADQTPVNHGRIIKWTQHIGFLTLAGMARVIEGNHGNDSKKGYQEYCISCRLAKFDYSLHFYFYELKQNKCVHVLYCDIITIKEDYCWLFFFLTKYSV